MTLRDHALAKGAVAHRRRGGPRRAATPTCGTSRRSRSWGDRYAADAPLTAYRPPARAASSTPTCCGRARPAAPASSSARSTSSTSTTSSTCAATRCSWSRPSPRRPASMLSNLEHAGRPVGPRGGAAPGVGRAARLRRARSSAPTAGPTHPRRRRVPLLGRLRRSARRGRPADRAGRWRPLLHEAGVEFMVLGDAESCTGDPARRMGHEYLFQMLAQQNVETLNEAGARTHRRDLRPLLQHPRQRVPPARRALRGRPPHPAAGQARGRRSARPRSAPVDASRSPTTTPATSAGTTASSRRPARSSAASPALTLTEMPRNRERSFCCGAGGARMWMDEDLGTRINLNRTDEALALAARPRHRGLPVLHRPC